MPTGTGTDLISMLPIVAIIAVFFLLMYLPQRKKKKQFKAMMDSLGTGKMVKTIGGMYGKIVAVKEDLVTIETTPDKVRLMFTKGAIATVEDSDAEENTLDKK